MASEDGQRTNIFGVCTFCDPWVAWANSHSFPLVKSWHQFWATQAVLLLVGLDPAPGVLWHFCCVRFDSNVLLELRKISRVICEVLGLNLTSKTNSQYLGDLAVVGP